MLSCKPGQQIHAPTHSHLRDNPACLADMLGRLSAMKVSEAASLIPANWLKARSGTPARMVA